VRADEELDCVSGTRGGGVDAFRCSKPMSDAIGGGVDVGDALGQVEGLVMVSGSESG